MRVLTWNCNRALSKKAAALIALNPDVAVIQECEKAFAAPVGYRFLWTGVLSNMGLGVLCRDPDAHNDPVEDPRWTFFMPVTLPGMGLRVLATWAFQRRAANTEAPDRVGTIPPVLDSLGDWMSTGPSLMVGDFNHNATWDTPRGRNNFRPVVQRLSDLGLSSAYHQQSGEAFGHESTPTHHFRKNPESRYHIDYCFAHKSLSVRGARVLVSEEWAKLSDHFPLVVDFDPV